MKPLYGTYVPIHYGNYQAAFPERELERDKVVNVIMMEYVQGSKLSNKISDISSWTDDEIDALLQQLYQSLDQIHALSVVHRDVRPDNVIIRKHGDPTWIDWTSSITLHEYPQRWREDMKERDIDMVGDFMEEALEERP